MLTSAEEVTRWLKLQEEVVVLVSAYLAPLKAYVAKCEADPAYADDITGVYKLHTLAQDLDEMLLVQSLKKLNLDTYWLPFHRPSGLLKIKTTMQTIPSQKQPSHEFILLIRKYVDAISETVVAFAKNPPPSFSVTLAAGTPFDAYLLVSRLVESATQYVYIADAYLDASVFDRYLYRVKDGVRVLLRTNPSNWSRKGWKEQFEQAEALFSAQHPNYDRADRSDLHARYLVTEKGAWRIDGSIKDIAAAKDCPIHTVTPEERDRVVRELFS
jgi:hypothetical protein